jgi:hypothetical protein
VSRDGGDFELSLESPLVQALDVFENVLNGIIANANGSSPEGAEHESIIWIGTMPDS